MILKLRCSFKITPDQDEMLETARLLIRPFQEGDLPEIHRILCAAFGEPEGGATALGQRRAWLEWSALSAEWLPRLHQPPYGDRAVVLKEGGALLGAVGLVPLLAPFAQLPSFGAKPPGGSFSPEVGLFWAIDPPHQRQGYASEAAQALIQVAFTEMKLGRILATTETDNLASQGVMRRLGMRLERNPYPEPFWLQVVGILEPPP